MRDLIDAWRVTRQSRRDCVLCSVVETRGSTPQKAGAAMLVFPDGAQVGTLGGGCVEAEVRRRALSLHGVPDPVLMSFTLDDDYGWDDGLICGGKMTFLVQPLPASAHATFFDRLFDLVESGQGGAEAVVIDERVNGRMGARFLFDASGELLERWRSEDVPATVSESVARAIESPKARSAAGVAILPILPRCRLVIVGAGHVGQAVAELAHQVDFEVWVIDDRETYASSERFPHARRLLVGDLPATLKNLESDRNTYLLIVTRGHGHDQESLYHLATKTSRYIGLIGSKRKIRMIRDNLLAAGISQEALDRVHAPLGIDIGSRTVPEIAVSIVAQLIGHRNLGAKAFPPSGLMRAESEA